MRVYRCRFAGLAGRAAENGSAAGDSDDGNVFLWFGERELEQYALPNVFVKILKQAGSYGS
jgi:hypothetical protein